MGECNTILSAYTLYRHLGWCCTHPSICASQTHHLDFYAPISKDRGILFYRCPSLLICNMKT